MTKYAIIVAALVTLTGCQSGGNRGTHSSASRSDSGGMSQPSTTYDSSGTQIDREMARSTGTSVSDQAETGDVDRNDQLANTTAPIASDEINSPVRSSTTDKGGNSNDQGHTASQAIASSNPSPATDTSDQSSTGADAGANSGVSQAGTLGPNSARQDQLTPDSSEAPTQPGALDPNSIAAGTALGGSMSASDQAIAQSVTNSLATAGIASHTLNNIQVRALNGRIVLTGQVASQTEKQRIETKVRQTPGVRMVVNQLRVGAGPDANPSALGGPGASGATSGVGSGSSHPGDADTSQGNAAGGNPSGASRPDAGDSSGNSPR